MFNKEIYISRRNKLKKLVNDGIIILFGNFDSPINFYNNQYYFRQDSTFLYFFGINLPNLIAVIDINNNEEVIFGNNSDIDDIVWTGKELKINEIANQIGISTTYPLSHVANYLKNKKNIHFLPPYRAEHKLLLSEILNIPSEKQKLLASKKLIQSIVSLREIKDENEIHEITSAINKTYEMIDYAIKNIKTLQYEKDILALFKKFATENDMNFSFQPIITINNQILHNTEFKNKLIPNQLLLIDTGLETENGYAGDISRIFPIGGKFTPEQQYIYEIVEDTYTKCIDLCKPDIKFLDVHLFAYENIALGLKELNILKGNIDDILTSGVITTFFPCGLGHFLGLDVHDMENYGEELVGYNDKIKKSSEFGLKSLRLAKELKENFVLTIEPGIYFIPELIKQRIKDSKYSQFINKDILEKFIYVKGIRIEDDFLITKKGAKKLGNHFPNKYNEIKEYINEIY